MKTQILLKVIAILSLSYSMFVHAEPSSSFNIATGILNVPCVEIVVNGQPAGDGGNRLAYSLDLALSGSILVASNAAEISATGDCSASFESTTGVYTDLVTVGDDNVELRLAYSGGVDFSPLSVFIQRNFNVNDLSIAINQSTNIPLASSIDTQSATLSLSDGSAAPNFVTLNNGEIVISPQSNDIGEYTLRVEWGDQVEFIKVNVSDQLDTLVTFSELPSALPDFNSLNLYSSESIFNTPLPEDPEIDPNSNLLLQGLVQSEQFVVQVGQFSATVFFANNQTSLSNVALPCGEFWELGISEIVQVPIPDWAIPSNDIDGGDEPPVGCGEESGQDNFLIILDLENRCEYDFWQARGGVGSWESSFATALNMDGPGVNPNGLSSRGSGLGFLGGVIWPSELINGSINHPLSFSYEFPKANGPVAPATDSDGVSEEPFALPEGARIQLDPELNLDSLNLTDHERTIAKAMQEYGLILVDRGGAGPVGLYAIDPDSVSSNPYSAIWGEDDFVSLPNLDIASLPFRVLKLPEQNSNWRQTLALANNSCANYQ